MSSEPLKWPFRADGDTVLDAGGRFVAACESDDTAKLVAASTWLYLYWLATTDIFRDAGAGRAPSERQYNRVAGYAEECEKALKGYKPR